MGRYLVRVCGVAVLALSLSACSPERDAASRGVLPEWDGFVAEFIETYFLVHPAFAVVQGRHEFDGQLPDWSRQGIEREIDLLKTLRQRALEFGDAELTPHQAFQRDYLIARIRHDLFWLEKAQWPFKNPAYYFGWLSDGLDPAPYVTLSYAPPAERLRAITTYLATIPRAVAQIRENLATPMPRTYVEYGIAAFGGMAEYYAVDLPVAFAEVDDESLQLALVEVLGPAVQAMNDIQAWLEQELGNATDDFALGPELFDAMLRDTEGIDISLEELEQVARVDLTRNTETLRAVCADYAPGESIQACFSRMAENRPQGGVVEAATTQLDELRDFMLSEDLATVYLDEDALVREAPPYARSNFAYISIPGPYETGQPSIYYIAPPDPAWSEEVRLAYVPGKADLLFTSVHEVWPGHFHNFLHAKRSDDVFGRIFVGYAYSEGWAHYTEEMMLEAGLGGGDPEVTIGQLSNALLRNIRFLAAIGLHAKGMSVDQAEQLFITEGFQSEGTARRQAARGTYDPAYLNYTVGKLLIKQLREDWTRTRGGRGAWKAFHDEFLSYGGPPIPLVRARMMGGESEAVFWQEQWEQREQQK